MFRVLRDCEVKSICMSAVCLSYMLAWLSQTHVAIWLVMNCIYMLSVDQVFCESRILVLITVYGLFCLV